LYGSGWSSRGLPGVLLGMCGFFSSVVVLRKVFWSWFLGVLGLVTQPIEETDTRNTAQTRSKETLTSRDILRKTTKSHTPSTKIRHTHFTRESFVTKDENTTQSQTLAQREKFTKANHENKNNGKPDTPRNQD